MSNSPMDDFLPLLRQVFRTQHGLPGTDVPIHVPSEDRERLFVWARRHRVTGLLQAGFPELAANLQTAAYGQARHTALFTHEAARLFALLAPRLQALALVKGPALAAQAWPAPDLRIFDDLDFQCAREDFPRLAAGLAEAGYAPRIDDPRRMAHRWHYGWGVGFQHPDGYKVEVNHRFFPPHYPWPCGLTTDRADLFVMQPLDDAPMRVPAPALHLLQCCLHAVWHGWERLAWLVDIAGLLARHPDSLAQAQTLTTECPFAARTLAAGWAVADAVFGPGLAGGGRMSPAEPAVAEARAILAGAAPTPAGSRLRKFHEQFMRPAEKAVYRLRRVFTPGDGDFQWYSLPPALRGLYWLLRPVRATITYNYM